MNFVNDTSSSVFWRVDENCQINAPMTTSTSQNSRLFRVEFKGSFLSHSPEKDAAACASDTRVLVGRTVYLFSFKTTTPAEGAVTRHSSAIVTPATHTIRSAASTTMGTPSRPARGIFR